MSKSQDVRVVRIRGLNSPKFAAKAHTKSPVLTYNNGPLLANVEVFTVFWGGDWKNQPALASLAQSINGFFTFILTSSLIDQLSEYNVPGLTIGHGSLVGTKTITDAEPGSTIDDSAVQTTLQGWIANDPDFPQPNANSLYFIYFPPGTTITLQGSSSCQTFGGYHDSFADSSGTNIFYAVEPFCMPFDSSMTQLDFFTFTSSHELCESITDPIPGQGWYWFQDQQNQGEIGDICEAAPNAEERIGSFLVQREWSNKQKKCV